MYVCIEREGEAGYYKVNPVSCPFHTLSTFISPQAPGAPVVLQAQTVLCVPSQGCTAQAWREQTPPALLEPQSPDTGHAVTHIWEALSALDYRLLGPLHSLHKASDYVWRLFKAVPVMEGDWRNSVFGIWFLVTVPGGSGG